MGLVTDIATSRRSPRSESRTLDRLQRRHETVMASRLLHKPWLAPRRAAPGVFTGEAVAEYTRCFRDSAAIHANCEDYRASAGIDLQHDVADADRRIECPLLVLWGTRGIIGELFGPVDAWREKAPDVRGQPIDCGHYLAEEAPDATLAALLGFLK
jgi:haloacetate dehalogenase